METDLNPSQLLIECFAYTSEHSSLWVGAGITDANGAFKIAIKEAYNSAPLKLKVYNHAQLIHEALIDGIKNDIIMEIQTGSFDFLVDNDHLEKFHADYISVSGNINLGAEQIPAVPANEGIAVVLSQASFGVNEAIAGSYIDSMGNYEIRLPYRLLFSKQMAEKFSNSPLLIIEVVQAETTLLAQSELFEIQSQDTSVNLNIAIAHKQYFLDEWRLVKNRMMSVTRLDTFETIPNDINSIRRISNASGLQEAMVSNMLQADLLAREIDIPLAHAYTFKRAGWDNYTDTEKAKDLITKAVVNHVIDALYSDYNNTVDALGIKSIKDEGNKFISDKETLKDIILAITNDELITEIFIRESMKETDETPEAFWTRIEELVGITYKALLQKGLQVVALVGIQKETVIYILAALKAANEQPLADYVQGKNIASWSSIINELSIQHEKLCVADEFQDMEDPETAYATYIYENSNKLFYTAFIKNEVLDSLIETGGTEPVIKNIPALKTFLAQYPKYDFRIDNIWEQSDKISSMELHKDLQTLQNVSRIASGNVELMKGMLAAGIRSSFQIADMSEADFMEVMGAKVSLAATSKLKHAYELASQIDRYIKGAYTQLNPSNFAISNLTKEAVSRTVWQSQGNPNSTFAYPDLETLFGSQDFCACTECSSMYSPSAYFTDVMNFIRTKVGTSTALKTLDKRRPDLKYIDLSCKNANTLLPYIDLVNETLELQILNYYKSINEPGFQNISIPGSFQTRGTEAELDANPEHVYKNAGVYTDYEDYTLVYDKKLSKAIYPNTLPFNMAKVESDAFLAHSGLSKVALMNNFRPATFNVSNSNEGINTYTRAAAYLGIDVSAADIISGSTLYGDWAFYGTDQTGFANLNEDLESLLKKTSLEYTEFLQIMVTDYLNPVVAGTSNRRFAITAKAGFPADTCALEELRLECRPATGEQAAELKAVFFKHLHRFVRLFKATKWSIYQLDIVLRSIGLNNLYVKDTNTNAYVDRLTKTVFTAIAGVKEVSDIFGKAPEHICTLWSNLDTYSYIDFEKEQVLAPSVYDSFFRNKSLLNPLDPNFENPAQISGTVQENAGTISAVLQIDVKQIAEILNNDLSQATDLAMLSHILRNQAYAAFFGNNSFTNCVERLRLINHTLPFVTPLNIPEILDMVKEFEWADQEVFSWEERAYLLTGKDTAGNFTPTNNTIEQFLGNLRKTLKAIAKDTDIEDPANVALKNRLKQEADHLFTDTFNLPKTVFTDPLGEPAESFIQPFLELSGGLNLLDDVLSKNEFVQGTADLKPTVILANGITADEVYKIYRLLSKITMMSDKLKLDDELISFFHNKDTGFLPANLFSAYDFSNLDSLFAIGFTAYLKWIKIRDFFNLNTEVLQKMIEATDLVVWTKLIVDHTGLDTESMEMVLGSIAFPQSTQNITGILEGYFNDTAGATPHNGNMDLLLQAYDIIRHSRSLGMQVNDLYAAIRPEASLQQARMIRKATKSKYGPEQWLKVVKPIQNKLRTAQRDAMVDYILAKPGIVGSTAAVLKTANNLFEHLLIDVEMESCMKTSRLKMAISSAQLFMNRAILKLEKSPDGSTTINLSQEAITQWHEWRKWYRIWEANRKVFLYPENWIEPELRDKKTKFFRELEAHLLQDEITDARVEDGFRIYLEGLNEVARLEPVSAYQQTAYGRNILHVFARTDSNPQRYYYRNREDNEWSDWQKIDVDIKSDHVSPVMWNNKLYVFWLTFQKTNGAKQSNESTTNSGTVGNGKPGMRGNSDQKKAAEFNSNQWTNILTTANGGNLFADAGDEQYTVWKVTLNWTQLQNGKWQSQEMCKDIMELDINKFKINEVNKESYTFPEAKAAIELLTSMNTVKIDEFFKNRIYLYTPFEGEVANGTYGIVFNIVIPGGLVEVGIGAHTFLWKGDNSRDPYILMDSDRGCAVIAPTGTRFNKMKFIQDPKLISSGLKADTRVASYADGYYVFYTNEYFPSVMHKPVKSETVLGRTPNRYRLTASAPVVKDSVKFNPLRNTFFFEDQHHTFLVEESNTQLALIKNVNADSIMLTEALQVKERSASTQTIFALMANSTPKFTPTSEEAMPIMSKFRFNTFYHAQVPSLIASLNQSGVPGLLTLANQSQADTIKFATTYSPTGLVDTKYPVSNMQFAFSDPYSMYNWEVFFHAPMMIAQGLTQNQQFAAAQKWFHYIFDPTSSSGNGKQRFWKFKPFFDEAGGTIQTLPQLLQAIHNNGAAVDQVKAWEKDPFNPHRIARMRVLAYMKNVVMKYLDNLIAWADNLFRQDTMESINEATQLYILAANILGDRPQQIPQRVKRSDLAFYNFMPYLFNHTNATQQANSAYITQLDALSNAMVAIESFYAPNAAAGTSVYSGTNLATMPPRKEDGNIPLQTFYFCLPNNDKLIKYWDLIADRLFKIRNCKNIEGLTRQLSLYESPIDPALLVRAKAMGISTESFLSQLYGAKRPLHRFSYMVQKTNELLGDVKALGGAMLSALEKKDAEAIALLRSTQEYEMLTKVRSVREQQVEEAAKNLEGLRISQANTKQRFDYYASRKFTNANEQKHLDKMQSAMEAQVIQGILNTVAGVVSAIPQISTLPPSAELGGLQLANVLNAAGTAVGIKASIDSAKGAMAATKGGYERRMDDWQFQKASAAKELEQLEQQIFAAQVRLDITKQELRNHELQTEQNREMDTYMRSKFSNAELYNWMISQLATTYFQSYQMAFTMARQAEQCYEYELGKITPAGIIKQGYWDSLKRGLLSGENLQLDVRRLEKAYMEANKRELELTKNISLALFQPQAILDIKATGKANITIPEVLFDMDYPGHYMRRIKSVSISIPCIAGPYTTVNCQLSQVNSKYRKVSTASDYNNAAHFTELKDSSIIATSTAQNDSGVFELNFRDERYLPFEGTGAISTWTISFPGKIRQFDLNSINDIIFHIKYTAQYDGGLEKAANDSVKELFETLTTTAGFNAHMLQYYTSAKHEHSADWFDYGKKFTDNESTRLALSFNQEQFPFFTKGKKVTVKAIKPAVLLKSKLTGNYTLSVTYTSNGTYVTQSIPVSTDAAAGKLVTLNMIPLNTQPIVFQQNTKVVQVGLKDSSNKAVNATQLFEDMIFVMDYIIEEGVPAQAANDKPEFDLNLNLNQLIAWWAADEAQNTVTSTQGVEVLYDKSGHNRHLQHLNGWNGAELPKLRTVDSIPQVYFNGMSGLIERIAYGAAKGLENNTSFTLISVANGGFGTSMEGFFNNDNNDVKFQLRIGGGHMVMNDGHWSFAYLPIQAAKENMLQLDTFEQKPTSPTEGITYLSSYDRNGNKLETYTLNSVGINGGISTGMRIGFGGAIPALENVFYETLVFDGILTESEIKYILSYLKSKYPFLN